MPVLIVATCILVLNFFYEYFRHYRNLKSIPIRIHVNGTRGKSSVTRLIAAGLRAGGIKTIAKTTGTIPRVILDDGRESDIVRIGPANIIEQKYVFRFASRLKPKAIVVECMAVNPNYQWVTEKKFVQSTISVMTNCRLDHLDLMGGNIDSVTMSLSNTIPKNGKCFTSEAHQFDLLKRVAEHRNTEIKLVKPGEIKPEEMLKFHYIEHEDNLALALAVCKECGVSESIALKGMQEAIPDPGALRKFFIQQEKKSLHFYNVFAANDPESTVFIWHKIADRLTGPEKQKLIVLNTRADRYSRSQQLIDYCKDLDYDYIVLTGERTEQLAHYALNHNVDKAKIVVLGEIDPSLVFDNVLALTNEESHIFGIGNIAGDHNYGAQIVNYFYKKSRQKFA